MSLVLGALIILAVTAAAVTAMLLVRRNAPDGSYFADGDRAAGVFGVLATGFSVLLGFVVFLAFTSYDTARSGAETEALIVAQQVETAQFFSPETATELSTQLVCYARSVTGIQWDKMEDGSIGDSLNPWAVQMFVTIRAVTPASDTEQSAYDRWMDQTSAREVARNDRIHGAVGVIPTTLWIVLFFTALLIFGFVLFFADTGERAIVQGVLMGCVVAVIVAMLLLLYSLDHPFHDGVGGLQPVAMQRTLDIIGEQFAAVGLGEVTLCDAVGNPL